MRLLLPLFLLTHFLLSSCSLLLPYMPFSLFIARLKQGRLALKERSMSLKAVAFFLTEESTEMSFNFAALPTPRRRVAHQDYSKVPLFREAIETESTDC